MAASNVWKYSNYLPVPKGKIISMNEGNTSLVQSVQRENVWYKCEFQNPTGSFKDRGSTVEISHAVSDGYKKVVCASTGNMGASISAYAARAGITAVIVVPSHVPRIKLNQILAYGAALIKEKGTYTDALKKTWKMAERDKKIMLTGDYPLRMEGQKTIAFEIIDQLKGNVPAQIICPVGNGTLIAALHAGFIQMKQKKKIKTIPRLIGVQAEGCAPITRAWEKNTTRITPVLRPRTIAGAIECGTPVYGAEALRAVLETKGKMIQVTDKRIMEARLSLARTEGLFTENSGAAVHAAIGDHPLKGKTIGILGGHGLKEPT